MKLSTLAVAAAASLPLATAFQTSPRLPSANAPFSVALEASTAASAEELETNPRLSGLAFALDDGTRKSHSVAQNTAFVQGFFKGISSPDSYRNLLTSLYYVYEAMEVGVLDAVSKLESEDANWVKALDEAPLRRLSELEKDMEYFYGPDWRTTMTPPTKGTEAYVARIRELVADANDESEEETAKKDSLLYLFVAHQYTRYLGDLFGGQMMGSMASRSMDLPPDGSGVAFYTFDEVPSKKDFITQWYTTLNELGVSQAKQQAIVDEANLVFDLNIGILEELEGSPWTALWTMAVSGWINIKESKNGPAQQE